MLYTLVSKSSNKFRDQPLIYLPLNIIRVQNKTKQTPSILQLALYKTPQLAVLVPDARFSYSFLQMIHKRKCNHPLP